MAPGVFITYSNDPNAGSPTITLLRLLLPLGRAVIRTSTVVASLPKKAASHCLRTRNRKTQSVAATGGVYNVRPMSCFAYQCLPIRTLPSVRASQLGVTGGALPRGRDAPPVLYPTKKKNPEKSVQKASVLPHPTRV